MGCVLAVPAGCDEYGPASRDALGRGAVESHLQGQNNAADPSGTRTGGGPRETTNGFLNHRSGDSSCRNVWMLALGEGLEKGEADRTISHVDIAASAAAVLGVPGGEMEGRQVSEALVCAGPRGVCAGETRPHSSHAHLSMAATGPASSKAAGLQAP